MSSVAPSKLVDTAKPAKLVKPDIPRVAAPGCKRSSNGIEMLADEKEEWTGWCTLHGSAKPKKSSLKLPSMSSLKAFFSCSCASKTNDSGKYMAEMLLTNKRLVVRELVQKESKAGMPKGCVYYMCCCCCLPQTVHTTSIEDHAVYELADIKEFTMSMKHMKFEDSGCCGCFGCCACCASSGMTQGFTLQLTLTKDVGMFLPSPWIFEIDNKTSHTTILFDGQMDLTEAASLRSVLDSIVARNAAAAKDEVKVNRNLNN